MCEGDVDRFQTVAQRTGIYGVLILSAPRRIYGGEHIFHV